MLAEFTAAQHPEVAAALLEGSLDGDRSFVVLSVLEAFVRDGAGAGPIRDAERLMVGVARTAPTHELVRAACRVARDLSDAAAADLDEQWRAAAAMAVADGREGVLPFGPADEAPLLLVAGDQLVPGVDSRPVAPVIDRPAPGQRPLGGSRAVCDRRESCTGRDEAARPSRRHGRPSRSGRGVASVGGAGRGPRGTGPGRGDRPRRAEAGRSPPAGPRRCGTPRVRPPPRRAPVPRGSHARVGLTPAREHLAAALSASVLGATAPTDRPESCGSLPRGRGRGQRCAHRPLARRPRSGRSSRTGHAACWCPYGSRMRQEIARTPGVRRVRRRSAVPTPPMCRSSPRLLARARHRHTAGPHEGRGSTRADGVAQPPPTGKPRSPRRCFHVGRPAPRGRCGAVQQPGRPGRHRSSFEVVERTRWPLGTRRSRWSGSAGSSARRYRCSLRSPWRFSSSRFPWPGTKRPDAFPARARGCRRDTAMPCTG